MFPKPEKFRRVITREDRSLVASLGLSDPPPAPPVLGRRGGRGPSLVILDCFLPPTLSLEICVVCISRCKPDTHIIRVKQ